MNVELIEIIDTDFYIDAYLDRMTEEELRKKEIEYNSWVRIELNKLNPKNRLKKMSVGGKRY